VDHSLRIFLPSASSPSAAVMPTPTTRSIVSRPDAQDAARPRSGYGARYGSQPTLSRFENAVGRVSFIVWRGTAESVIERHAQRLHHRARLVTIDLDPTTIPRMGAAVVLLQQSLRQRVLSPDDGFVTFNDEANSICALPCCVRQRYSGDRRVEFCAG